MKIKQDEILAENFASKFEIKENIKHLNIIEVEKPVKATSRPKTVKNINLSKTPIFDNRKDLHLSAELLIKKFASLSDETQKIS